MKTPYKMNWKFKKELYQFQQIKNYESEEFYNTNIIKFMFYNIKFFNGYADDIEEIKEIFNTINKIKLYEGNPKHHQFYIGCIINNFLRKNETNTVSYRSSDNYYKLNEINFFDEIRNKNIEIPSIYFIFDNIKKEIEYFEEIKEYNEFYLVLHFKK
jgi:hypothetical protein